MLRAWRVAACAPTRSGVAARPRLSRGRLVARALRSLVAAVLVVAAAGAARADVVPPEAVAVADGWFRLVDRHQAGRAIDRYAQPDAAAALRRRLAERKPRARPVLRSMRAWRGVGDGDSSRMAPGGFFALGYDVVDGDGNTGIDEVRMRPDGRGGWRIVDVVRDADAVTANR